jgi:hypothetical protein
MPEPTAKKPDPQPHARCQAAGRTRPSGSASPTSALLVSESWRGTGAAGQAPKTAPAQKLRPGAGHSHLHWPGPGLLYGQQSRRVPWSAAAAPPVPALRARADANRAHSFSRAGRRCPRTARAESSEEGTCSWLRCAAQVMATAGPAGADRDRMRRNAAPIHPLLGATEHRSSRLTTRVNCAERRICAPQSAAPSGSDSRQIGGSARGYLPGFAWLAAPLWSNARAAVRMFIHRRPRGERPHLPR